MTLLQWLVPVLMVIAPLTFYPFSKLVFVAIDLAMHPDAEPDALAHGPIFPTPPQPETTPAPPPPSRR